MLIQNLSSTTQAQSPARPAGDGGPVVVAASPNAPAGPVAADQPRTAVDPTAERQASAAQLREALTYVNRALQQSNKNLEFTVDGATERPIVKLIDSDTGEVIRQFPTEEALAISRAIGDFQQGVLLRKQA
jgi:flagellar protein FlaG